MRKSSVHFRPLKTTSENHNFRQVNLDYNFKYFERNNESFSYDKRKLNSIKKAVTKHIEKKTGRKVRNNATPIKEGVVVLEKHHTIEDLKVLCDAYKKELGITPLQIHIHRDEGKSPSDLNYHAHIVGIFYNLDTGKSLRLSKADMQRMQDITAEVLGMERGVSKEKSNRKHLESKIYAERQQHLKLQEILKDLETTKKSLEKYARTDTGWLWVKTKTLEENTTELHEKLQLLKSKLARFQAQVLELEKQKKERELLERERLKREKEVVLATETPQISIIPKKTEDIERERKKDDLEPKKLSYLENLKQSYDALKKGGLSEEEQKKHEDVIAKSPSVSIAYEKLKLEKELESENQKLKKRGPRL